jgi:hypothetical protein
MEMQEAAAASAYNDNSDHEGPSRRSAKRQRTDGAYADYDGEAPHNSNHFSSSSSRSRPAVPETSSRSSQASANQRAPNVAGMLFIE